MNIHKNINKEVALFLNTRDYEKIRTIFNDFCSEIAARYNLYYSNGEPRKAKIIEIIARTTCTFCIDRRLREDRPNRVDDLYKECHQLACNLLVEELYSHLRSIGYAVLVSSDKNVEYGKVDIFIVPNRHDISLHCSNKEVAVEVKTGFSLSLSQLFRYTLDNPDRAIVVWRIRNKQVLVFEGTDLKPLLMHFMRMCILRGRRFLINSETSCEHTIPSETWSPTQEQLQQMFEDFAQALVETLPHVMKTVLEKLGIHAKD